MDSLTCTIQVTYQHQVHFTEIVFDASNALLGDVLASRCGRKIARALIVYDASLLETPPLWR